MKNIVFLLLFSLFINLYSYEVKPGETIKTKTLYTDRGGWDSDLNFILTKEERKKAKNFADRLDIGVANFIKEIGAENVLDIKMSGSRGEYRHFLHATIVYKEKLTPY